MAKILVMTDLHLTPEGETIIGLDPGARLAQGLAHAAREHPDADRLILMGDLTHHGRGAEYARLKSLLSALPWPVTLMIGNHDNRAAFRAAFPGTATDENGFVQSVTDAGDVRLVCLDTHEIRPRVQHAGRLCPQRMDWLTRTLAADTRPCLVFLHHPPFATGFAGMDGIGLLNAAELRSQPMPTWRMSLPGIFTAPSPLRSTGCLSPSSKAPATRCPCCLGHPVSAIRWPSPVPMASS